MDIIKRLVREVLSTPPKKKKEKCNCGCHSCENVGNKGPVLNENLEARIIMTENMKYHVTNKLPLTENTFRYGSKSFLDLWAEARYLFSRDAIHVNDDDKEILLETNLGEYGYYENQKVPLDLPMLEEEEGSRSFILPYESLLRQIKKDADSYKEEEGKLMDLYYEIEQAIFDKNVPQMLSILRKYGLYGKYSTLLNINESDKKKTPALNKPKRGGSKKFYVYVRDPKTKRVKKVSFGMAGGGLKAKINNPKARQAFAKRHNCAQKKDKTKASYWSCRLPRYAKLLGLKSSFSGFW
jgi:hypothetical protein